MQDKSRVGGKFFPPFATLSMRAVAADQSSEDEGANESNQVKSYRALLSAMIDCEMLEVRGETSAGTDNRVRINGSLRSGVFNPCRITQTTKTTHQATTCHPSQIRVFDGQFWCPSFRLPGAPQGEGC
jgi:hypothetical protein